jgi:leader peptidase (prepilin peptidase) / N-methyltransferase
LTEIRRDNELGRGPKKADIQCDDNQCYCTDRRPIFPCPFHEAKCTILDLQRVRSDTWSMMTGFLFILGLLVGSFANVLIDRLPRGESIWWGRSHCDYCKKTLQWYELIPVISFVLQGGRCKRCHKKLSIQYPLVEIITGIGFAAVHSLPFSILFVSLLVIFVTDLKYQIIPDSMIVLGIGGAFGTGFHVISAAGSFLFLYLLWMITRKRGIGFGDVKFASLMGLVLGYPGIIIAFYIAFLTGAFVGVILMIARYKTWKSKIAFGPFLVFGTVTALVWQPQLLAMWRMFI